MPDEQPRSSTRLQLLDDGSIGIPLRGARRGETLILEEPSLDELADVYAICAAADERLPTIRVVDRGSEPSEISEALKDGQARAQAQYGKNSPHAAAWIEVIRIITGEEVTIAELPSWVGNPSAFAQALTHWTAPLGGLDSLATM